MTHDRDRFEAAMRMLGEARNDAAVIHPPAVLAFEILPEVAPRERRRGTHVLVTFRISIVVIHAEQEWIGGLPGQAQRRYPQYNVLGHVLTSRQIEYQNFT